MISGVQDGPAQTPRTIRKDRAGTKGGLGEEEVVGLQPQQLSLVDASHRACVTDLHWLPGLGINREGRPPSRPASVCPWASRPGISFRQSGRLAMSHCSHACKLLLGAIQHAPHLIMCMVSVLEECRSGWSRRAANSGCSHGYANVSPLCRLV